MYSTSSKDEVVVKLVGRLTIEFPDLDQLRARQLIEETLYKYEIAPAETALVARDIEEKIQIYLATKRLDGLSKKTLYSYELNLVMFASHLRKPLTTVSTMDLRMYLAVRCKKLKQSSVNTQISILKSFFAWLANEEYIPKNPTAKLTQVKQPKRVRQAMTDEEVELLRQACEKLCEKCIIEFLIATGCRLSEIVNVDIAHINWNEKSLFVIGKGDKERKVYFTAKAKVLLQAYLATRTDDNPALFVADKGEHKRLGGRSIENEVHKVAVRAGFEKSVYPHLFRHTFATSKINAGMPLPVLQHIMGHDDPSTTQIYAKLSEENILHEYKKIS